MSSLSNSIDLFWRHEKQIHSEYQSLRGRAAINKPSRERLQRVFRETGSRSRAVESSLVEADTRTGPDAELVESTSYLETQMQHINVTYPPSLTPLSDLKPIVITNLRMQTRHEDRVLFLKTICRPVRTVVLQAAVEDDEANVDRLVLCFSDLGALPDDILPENTVLAIKEPYYEAITGAYGNLEYCIRVDHPSDLVIVQPTDKPTSSPLVASLKISLCSKREFMVAGDRAFTQKRHHEALHSYTNAINTWGDDPLLQSGVYKTRSRVNFHLKRYEAAEADARASVTPGQINSESFYRAGIAAYRLGKFGQARLDFTEALRIIPGNPFTVRQLARTNARLRESTTGVYDFEKMASASLRGNHRLDCANFTKSVVIGKSSTNGRGLFAKQRFQSGDLILCEKAFESAFMSDNVDKFRIFLDMTTAAPRALSACETDLLINIVAKLRNNPGLAAQFFQLRDDTDVSNPQTQQVDDSVVFDVFHIKKIVYENFRAGYDVRTVDQALDTNYIYANPQSVSVWLTGSYFNHDCCGNATLAILGDMMIVRACRDIAEDEEITIPYHHFESFDPQTLTSSQQQDRILRFHCECEKCTAEDAVSRPVLAQRNKLLREEFLVWVAKNVSSEFRPSRDNQKIKDMIKKIEELYGKIEATYPVNLYKALPRMGLVYISTWICSAYGRLGRNGKRWDWTLRALRDLGLFVSIENKTLLKIDRSHMMLNLATIDTFADAAKTAHALRMKEIGHQLENLAKELYWALFSTMYGFERRYKDDIRMGRPEE